MLRFFKTLSLQRRGWFLLFLSSLALESTALYFQYGMDLQPCVMCIYERVALFGIMLASLVGMIYPRAVFIRFSALIIALISTIKGLSIALTHVDYQRNPAPWKQCTVTPDFPQTLPLHQWLPELFQPTGSCTEISWQLFNISMAEWIVVIFAGYLLILSLVLISQVKRIQPEYRRLFR